MAKSKRYGLYRHGGGDLFCFRWKDVSGKWREKSAETTDYQQAKAFRARFLDDVEKDALPTDKKDWTVAQAGALYVKQHSAHLHSEKWKRNEQSLLRQMVRRLGDRKLKTITVDDLHNYQADRRRSEDNPQGVGERIVNLELRILVNVLKTAKLWRRIQLDYKPLKEPRSKVGQALSREKLQRLEATAAMNPAWEVAYLAEILASNTGMRGGEIKKLQLADVDLEARRLRIQNAKTAAGDRLIELNKAAMEAVTKLYRRAELLGAHAPEHYLLPGNLSRHTKSSDPLKGSVGFDVSQHQQSWSTAWRNMRKAAKLDGIRFHDCRHTFITAMGERGVPLAVLENMVGHVSNAMIRHYTHISSEATRKAVELLDRAAFVEDFAEDSEKAPSAGGKLLQ